MQIATGEARDSLIGLEEYSVRQSCPEGRENDDKHVAPGESPLAVAWPGNRAVRGLPLS